MEHGSQGKEGNRILHAVSSICLKVSSMGAISIPIWNLFHGKGNLTVLVVFILSKRKLRWLNLNSWSVKKFRRQRVEVIAVYFVGQEEAPRSWRYSKEKISSRRSRSSYDNSLMLLTKRVAKHCMRYIRLMARCRYGDGTRCFYSRNGLIRAGYRVQKIPRTKTEKPRRIWNRIGRAQFAVCRR